MPWTMPHMGRAAMLPRHHSLYASLLIMQRLHAVLYLVSLLTMLYLYFGNAYSLSLRSYVSALLCTSECVFLLCYGIVYTRLQACLWPRRYVSQCTQR